MNFIIENKNIFVGLGIFLFFIILIFVLRTRTQNKIVEAYSQQDFENYFKQIDSFLGRYFFLEPQREFLKMNAYMALDDTESLYAQIEYFSNKKLNTKFKAEISLRLFNYFLGKRDAKGTKGSLAMLESAVGVEQSLRNRQMYDIYIQKNSKHLESMLKEYHTLSNDEDVDEMMLCQLEVMIGYQYSYNKDKKKAREMMDKAIEHSDNEIYKKGVEQVIKDLKL